MTIDTTTVPRRGLLLIVSSPSGAGKTTLTRLLLQEDTEIHLSVSVTTRPKRPSEVEGIHYHFIDAGRFEEMREGDELLESAKVHARRRSASGRSSGCAESG